MRPDERADARRTSAFWDALVAGEPLIDGGPEEHFIRDLHRLDDAPHVRATFATQLGTRLMPPDARVTRGSAQARKAHSMHAIPASRSGINRPTSGRRLPSIPRWFPSAVTVLVVVMLLGSAFGGEFNRFLNHEPERKQLAALDTTSEATPESTPEPVYVSENPDSGGTYRGTAARDGVNPGPGPVGNPALAWHVAPEAGGHFIQSVISGTRMFVQTGTYAGEADRGTESLNCFNISDGTACWSEPYKVTGSINDFTVEGNFLYVSQEGGIFAVNARTGDRIWSKSLDGYGAWYPPTLVGGVLITTLDQEKVVALDPIGGEIIWEAGVPEDVAARVGESSALNPFAAPSAAGDLILLKSTIGTVIAYEVATGEVAWTFDSAESVRTLGKNSDPISISNGVAYFTAALDDGDDTTKNEVKLFAIDTVTGQEAWPAINIPGIGTLAVSKNTIFYASRVGNAGKVITFDGATGKEIWSQDADGSLGSPTIASGLLYTTSYGQVIALDATTGELVWNVYLGNVSNFHVTNGLVVAVANSSILAIGGDPSTPLAEELVDLSGLPECVLPREVPTTELAGEPALTIPEETRLIPYGGGPSYDENGDVVSNEYNMNSMFPQLLATNLPEREPADDQTTAQIKETMFAYATCMGRPEFGFLQESAFYSDDFFRRGYVPFEEEVGYQGAWGMVDSQFSEQSWSNYSVVTLEDGRVAALANYGQGYGSLTIFANVDGVWLIDEYYRIVPEYSDFSQG